MNPETSTTPVMRPAVPAISRFRWVICGLLFFSTTINYMDRQVISFLKEFFCTPVAAGGFGWTNSDYSHLTAFFTGFYAGVTIIAGWFIDKIGTKLGLAISLEDARLHGGWLQAWGDRGKGSVFRLTVPRTAGKPLAGSPLPLEPDDFGGAGGYPGADIPGSGPNA